MPNRRAGNELRSDEVAGPVDIIRRFGPPGLLEIWER